MTVREQLLFLLQLQQADVKVRELQSAANQLPARLDPLRRDLAKLQGMLDVEKAKLGETEAWRKAQQDLLDREREALKAAQSKLQASKNSKEFGAASREVENKRKSISDREAELKKVVEASSSSAAQLTTRDKDVDGVRSELAQNEAGIADQLAALNAQLAEATASRDEARRHVDVGWLKTYDSLAAKRGYAVAPVVKGVCQGCHMALPPQLNNILARLESLETCPRCSRLVYRKELIEPAPPEPPPPPPKAEAPKKPKRERKPKAEKPKPVAATAPDPTGADDEPSVTSAVPVPVTFENTEVATPPPPPRLTPPPMQVVTPPADELESTDGAARDEASEASAREPSTAPAGES